MSDPTFKALDRTGRRSAESPDAERQSTPGNSPQFRGHPVPLQRGAQDASGTGPGPSRPSHSTSQTIRSPAVCAQDPETFYTTSAPWIGNLTALGEAVAQLASGGRAQTVIAVTAPTRNFAAILIAAGYLLAAPPVASREWQDRANVLQRGSPVRLLLNDRTVVGNFYGYHKKPGGDRVHVDGANWKVGHILGLEAADDHKETEFGHALTPPRGGFVSTRISEPAWGQIYHTSTTRVTIVGTKSRLEPELSLSLTTTASPRTFDRLQNIVRPRLGRSPCWASTILPGGTEDLSEIPMETELTILDGASAIRWLPEITTPLVIAVIDRSTADESAPATALQLRASGQSIDDLLDWHPTTGIESLAFRVSL